MKKTVLFFITFLLAAAPVWSTTETMKPRGNGDVHYLGIIKVYSASLYTGADTTGKSILDPESSKCLKIVYNVPISANDLIDGANTILERQHGAETLASINAEIGLLHAAYKPVEKGDIYTLCYDADSGTTTLSLNTRQLISIVSREFSTIYFGIWLGNKNPIDERLRKNLLAWNE